ncbi:hypothetical protein, partial [Actinomyces johnsonii]|uniref:hypothetical protein n=1 Tax=Actinomyces johnsonii TaxID=544581 RepID=UPI002852BC77
GPTQPQAKPRARQTKNKQPQETTQTRSPPEPNGIKNMTHYRVLKQHTQRDIHKEYSLLASRRRPDYDKQIGVPDSNSDRVTLISELYLLLSHR